MAKSNKGRKFFATTATAALVASAIVPVASAAQINDFNSISSYAQEAVQDLNDRGVIKGDQKGNFNPKSAITRAEAATILAGALELEGSGSTSFTDVKKSAWYYDAIDAAVANGIFQGQGAGKFNPSANLTRSEAAIILVDAFGLEGSADLKEFKDSASVKSWAEEALSIAVANGVMKGDDNGNLKPNASITRQDFALMYYRTEGVEGTEEVSGSVKAINNTTVEVTFEDAVADIKALDFAIEGLTISNAVVKQTDSKTVVLTTSAQTADVEYTVTVNEEVIGKFKGVSAVIPTAVKITEQSLQAQVGTQVTLKAQVEVAAGQSKAGIPVTFNIVNDAHIGTATLNQPIVAEAKTDENGVATYTYTRYAQTSYQLASHDEVQAYATGNPTARSFSKVYWANIQPLAITEVTAGNTVTNGGKKVYKVKAALGHAEKITDATGKVTGYKVNIGYQENINVTPDKAIKTVDVIDSKGTNLSYPGQFTSSTSGSNNLNNYVKEVELVLDANGEAVFTLSGNNAAITPFVFVDQKVNPSNAAGTEGRFEATELFAAAPKVTFSKVQTLGLALESVGVQYAASFLDNDKNHLADSLESIAVDGTKTFTKDQLTAALVNTGGRDYKATVTDKNGKLAPAGTPVKAEINIGSALKTNGGAVYIVDNNTRVVTKLTNDASTPVTGIKKTANLTTNAKGEVSFTLIGYKDAYATPTVYVESGDKAGLDANDLQQVGEIVYFSDAVVKTASLTVDEKSVTASETVEYTYSTVDQNGKAYRPANTSANYYVTFEVSTTFNPVNVTVGTGSFAHGSTAGEVGQGSTGTGTFVVRTNDQGVASIKVSSKNAIATSVNVVASASDASLPQLLTASNEFTTYATHDLHAKVVSVNAASNTVAVTDVNGKAFTYSYAGQKLQINGTDAVSETSFEAALTNAIANPASQSLSIKLVDGVYIFNVLTSTPAPGNAGSGTAFLISQLNSASTLAQVEALLAPAYPELSPAQVTTLATEILGLTTAGTTVTPANLNAKYVSKFVSAKSAVAVDTDADGNVDAIDVTFSENLANPNVLVASDFALATGTIASVTDTVTGDAVLRLNLTGVTGLSVGTLTVKSTTTAAATGKTLVSGSIAVTPFTVTTGVLATAGTVIGTVGTKQVETLTIDATAAVNTGDAIVTIKAAGFNGGASLNINVPVEVGDTQAVVATSVETALKANSTVNSFFDVTKTATTVVLTAKTAAANDTTANIAIAGGTNNVVTAVAASADTAAGSVPTAEVVTVTVTAGATNAGTVTAKIVDGSFTKEVSFQVAAGDSIGQVVSKMYNALNAENLVTSRYELDLTGTTVTLTNKTTGTTPATTVTVK